MHKIARILVPINHIDFLDYLIPEEANINDFVEVPIKNKKLIGIIWSILDVSEVPIEKLKPISNLLGYSASANMRIFLEKVAEYNIFPIGKVAKLVIPAIVKTPKKIRITKNSELIHNIKPLNESQEKAAKKILEYKDTYKAILLEGVTGSGKTEVYFHVISKILLEKPNSQILLLLPEILLTAQGLTRITKAFGDNIYVWHSGITPAQKRDMWFEVLSGKARIIIGARSALFLPFQNLSLIIIDEEHDSSYKQEEGVVYNARDMAVMRAHIESIPIILASATPSIETILNAKLGKYEKVHLAARFGGAVMPDIKIVDMTQNKSESKWLSDRLLEAVKAKLAKKEQVMLFLNRKGYAPLTLCRACSYRFMCDVCSSWLVEHRKERKLKCHHCGYKIPIPKVCFGCKEENTLVALGPGVERIEEEIKKIFNEARVLTLTKDSLKKSSDNDEYLNKILDNEVDILIGTQLLAKGHHFPRLTLVGVIDADVGIGGAEIKGAERTYQLLHQVSGRAGREQIKGEVYIQTYYPKNHIILSLKDNNPEHFIESEISVREQSEMPPFARLASILITGSKLEQAENFARKVVSVAPLYEKVQVLGPVSASLSRLKGRYRFRILVKSEKNFNIQHYIRSWLEQIKVPSYLHLKVDVDPYNCL